MRQTGYCPRGPFCAFAHVESKHVYNDDWLQCVEVKYLQCSDVIEFMYGYKKTLNETLMAIYQNTKAVI